MGRADRVWEPWQKEYAFGAFYLFPPEDLAATVDALRRAHDPVSADICQAHVSLTEPLRASLDERQFDEIRERLATLDPFTVRYGPIRGFPPHPGVALAIGPESAFRSLRDEIHATSAFAGTPHTRSAIPPHMTIAEFITTERSAELLHELSDAVAPGSFVCRDVVLAAPDDHFHFHEQARIRIGRSP